MGDGHRAEPQPTASKRVAQTLTFTCSAGAIMTRSYYNEINPYAAQWLRNLISAGHIAPGDVDERSVTEVKTADLKGYSQCHFFAGIGGWSLALRRAGWPDVEPVWTISCPCPPWSRGRIWHTERAGTKDHRDLWPAILPLIVKVRPVRIFGEQVAGKKAEPWIGRTTIDLIR